MPVCVSYNVSSGVGSPRSLILPEDVKRLLEQINNYCGKISVAKVNPSRSSTPLMLIMQPTPPKQKETSQLAELCGGLSGRLSDRSLVPQQFKYDEIKRPVYGSPSIYLPLMSNDSNLVVVEEQLAGWSKYSYPKSFSRFRSLSPSP